jgi:hypothetical protein
MPFDHALSDAPSISKPAKREPIIGLVAKWEPLYREAVRVELILLKAVEEIEAMGFEHHYPWICFGPKVTFRTFAEIEAYYAPIIEQKTYMAKEFRNKYIFLLSQKLAARERLKLDELEAAAEDAWANAYAVEGKMEGLKATTPAGLAAKARFAMVNCFGVDGGLFEAENEEDHHPAAITMLRSLIADLDQMSEGSR